MSILKYRNSASDPWEEIEAINGRDTIHVGPAAPSDSDIRMWLDTSAPGTSIVTSVNGKTGPVVLDASDVGIKIVGPLWTNPSPMSNFSAQTVNVDLSEYSFIMIVFHGNVSSTGSDTTAVQFFDVGQHGNILQTMTASPARQSRSFTYSSSGIVFENGATGSTSGAQYCVPVRIYGIKGVLPL